ncbi:unnamed protein product [Parascedosporium putredinis]|uniref:Delta(24)-sterol reductase n=1 Tax=Parascedosporium putredinis TaxID=1442378 RepID=A0A9P1GZH9_9PEZI|nr:unnamed protein product [Parascedosporium putredinis]CAI7991124.1 unnamed protein product [Parascedosporium putredinis]
MERHASEVSAISAAVARFYKTRTPFRVYHGSTNSTRPSGKTRANTVDTSRLDAVLSVDAATRIATVEPNVPMDQLVRATAPHGLTPPVVMEFPGITAGGGFSGTERPDLFRGAASAFGTLGVITLLGIRLVPARELVRLEYHLSRSFEDAVAKLREETGKEDNEFVDAITFAGDVTVTCAGRMVDGPVPEGQTVRRFTRPGDPWFYLRAEEVAKDLSKANETSHRRRASGDDVGDDSTRAVPATATTVVVDYIPLADYYFRYDRGAFWTGRYAFRYFLTPFNRITRRLLDPLLHTRVMYSALHKSGLADFYLTQDVAVPFDRSVEFHRWVADTYGIYPSGSAPARAPALPASADGIDGDGNGNNGNDDSDDERRYLSTFWNPASPEVINFGVWGPLSFDPAEAARLNRLLEAKLAELGGRKCLYAQTYYTEDEFWANYDRAAYEALRKNTAPRTSPAYTTKSGRGARRCAAPLGTVHKREDLESLARPRIVRRLQGVSGEITSLAKARRRRRWARLRGRLRKRE